MEVRKISDERYNFIKTNAAEIYNDIITSLEGNCSEPLYPGDERRIMGEAFVAVCVALYNSFNDAAKQRMLRWARGGILDALGYRTDTNRLMPATAKTIIRFSVAASQTQNIIIPIGTKVTPDGEVYFATTQAAVLQAGTFFIDVPAESVEGGAAYNGYAPDTITTLVDLLPFISEVTNTVTSHGGDDGEPYNTEGDDRYRERIRLSMSKRSTAGPNSAYRFYALSADPEIIDVKISTPEAGVVKIVPLMKNREIPNEDTIAAIYRACNPEDVRPMCDLLVVEPPTVVNYDVEIKYYTFVDNEADVINTVEGAGGAIDRYNEWQTGTIGRDINPDQLRRFILSPNWENGLAGAYRVDVISPEFRALDDVSVAKFSGKLTVSHEVVEE